MRILIYGLNFAPELSGVGKYTGELAEWLGERGEQVDVIAAPPYYPDWQVQPGYSQIWYSAERVAGARVVRCPLFVPRKPQTLSRILHLLSFAASSIPALMSMLFRRPDIIICVVPTVFCAPGALLFGLLSRAKTVLHVQDLEIEAMVGLGMAERSLSVRVALRIESWLLQRFDVVSTISAGMWRKLAGKMDCESSLVICPNWVDTNHVAPSEQVSALREQWNIPDSSCVVLYAGNLGKKQGLELLLEAAAAFAADERILFVVVGSGAARDELVTGAESRRLSNLRFFPLQPYENLPELLALANVHLVLQRAGAADLVMPSKLTSILAAGGHALITAEQDTELGRFCVENPGIAHRCEPENPIEFIELLKQMCADPDVRARRPNRVARAYAEKHLDRDRVLGEYFRTLQDE